MRAKGKLALGGDQWEPHNFYFFLGALFGDRWKIWAWPCLHADMLLPTDSIQTFECLGQMLKGNFVLEVQYKQVVEIFSIELNSQAEH